MVKKAPRSDHRPHGGKKPSVLFIYLVLEEKARTNPMGRDAIIAYVKRRFGASISKKTVSEAAGIFKSLSNGAHPIMDFRQKGKNGYLLGGLGGPLSKGEVLRLLECFSDISPEVAKKAFSSLRPLMKTEDANQVEAVRRSSLSLRGQEQGDDNGYFAKLEKIAGALSKKKEVIFDHRYLEGKNSDIKKEEGVCLSPYYLFSKRGCYYLLGGRPGGLRRSDGTGIPCFYIADIAHMENLRVSGDDILLTYEKCLYGKRLDFASYLGHVGFIREGNLRFSSDRGFPAEVYGEEGLLLTKMMYGDCFDVVSKDKNEGKGHYAIILKLDFDSLVSWGLYFAGRKLGRLSLEKRQFGAYLSHVLRRYGSAIAETYQIDFREFNKMKCGI